VLRSPKLCVPFKAFIPFLITYMHATFSTKLILLNLILLTVLSED
jgi:hypothetical protein